jgi:hypothetical protein
VCKMPDSCRAGQYNPGGYITPYSLKEVSTTPKAGMHHIFRLDGWRDFEASLQGSQLSRHLKKGVLFETPFLSPKRS